LVANAANAAFVGFADWKGAIIGKSAELASPAT
jgi:hypothetical protein